MNNSKRLSASVYIFLIVSALISMLLVLISCSKYGPGITPDSAAYIYASDSFSNGHGFQYLAYSSPYIQWPPLFPILLSILHFFGFGPRTASILINSSALGLLVFLAGLWMFKRFNRKSIAFIGTIMLTASVPLLQVSKFVWTETVFILMLFLCFMFFEKYLISQRKQNLVLSGVFAALACLERYMGITIIIAVVLFLAMQRKPIIKRAADIFIFGFVASIPTGIWIVRNIIVSSTMAGVRVPSPYSLGTNIKRTFKAIYLWVKPDNWFLKIVHGSVYDFFKLFEILILSSIVLVFAVIFIRSLANRQESIRKLLKPESGYLFTVVFNIVFCMIYLAYLIMSATSVAFEPINSRYVAPAFVSAALTFLILLDYISVYLSEYLKKPIIKVAFALLLCIFIVFPVINTAAEVKRNVESGAGGFSTTAWKNNKMIKYVKVIDLLDNNMNGHRYYSNMPESIYTLTGIRAFYTPKKNGPPMYGFDKFKDEIETAGEARLVWFGTAMPEGMYSPVDLAQHFKLEVIEQNSEGTVYRIVKK